MKALQVAILSFFMISVILGAVGTAIALPRLQKAQAMVPNLPDIMADLNTRPSLIFSADGTQLYSELSEYRTFVPRQEIPERVVMATLAAEDKRFFQHQGVDPWAIARIVFVGLRDREASQGGSTLSMQLSKKLFTSNERSIERKLDDMALAIMMERMKTKDQIIELYLNYNFYGKGAYGVAAAANIYFGKDLNELTIAEAALLARIVRRPSDQNPIDNPKVAVENRNIVLGIMREEKMITDEDYRKAINEPLKLRKDPPSPRKSPKKAGHFVDYVLSYLKTQHPEIDFSRGGYRVETTLNYKVQQQSEQILRSAVYRYRGARVNTGAFLCLDMDGRVIAMVGGMSYEDSQFNRTTQGLRQPGSSFKPFVYAAAFEYGALSPYGEVNNGQFLITTGSRRRNIEGGGSLGFVSVRSAMAQSYNRAAMWAQRNAGTENVVNMAKVSFGFRSEMRPVPTLALGANEVTMMEMAEAYTVFQSGGDRVKPNPILRVIGPDGSAIKLFEPQRVRNVVSSNTANGIDRLLRATVTDGTGKFASYVTNARGKTGTTSDHKDAWFCGYTARFVGVMWLGREGVRNGRPVSLPMSGVYGGQYSAPLWAKLMSNIQKSLGEPQWSNRRGDSDGTSVTITDQPADEPSVVPPPIDEPLPEDGGPVGGSGQGSSTGPGEGTGGGVRVYPPEGDGGNVPSGGTTGTSVPEDDIVYVEVCADTGQKATIYCPERVKRPFKKGTEPRKPCPVHGPGR
ncbi:MAG: transglycosylase domain-containing protein [Fimbriimonadaceae bacterium]|nr:transglycosylase domain-containing protein [Fimbriimonadaceae bacterium]